MNKGKHQMATDNLDEDKVEEILHSILNTITPYQRLENFASILVALQDALSFQMALACPVCRKRLAHTLRHNVPEILHRANRLAAASPPAKCNLH
jgi:hypothetical protein